MRWLLLIGAIVTEVAGTLALQASQRERRARWLLATLAAYVASFACLSVALAHGLPLGIAYSIWTACGVALTAVLARVLFAEPLTRIMGLGIVLIVCGVVVVELSVQHT
jgi:small multidrug resistance pump